MAKWLRRVFNELLYASCILLAVLFIVFCLNRALLTYQSPNWAQTDGQIIASYISREGKNGGIIYFKALYRYRVDNLIYTGNEVGYGFSGAPFGEEWELARAKAALYPTGARVAVYFNPSAPADSCLETGGNWRGYGYPIGVGILFIVFGVRGLCQQMPKSRKSNQEH